MKKIIFFLSIFLSVFSTKAEFGVWRKTGVKCGTGQNALGCIISNLNDNTFGQKLNCPEDYFLEQVVYVYNLQTGYNFSSSEARSAFVDGRMFIVEWPASDLMNSGLKDGKAHYFPMTGSSKVKVIASKDLSGRTIPLVKAEGTGGEACFNVCYSKSIRPYKEEKQAIVIKEEIIERAELPQAIAFASLPVSAPGPEQRLIQLNYWPQQPFQMAVISVNQVQVFQPAIVFLPNKQCFNNVVTQPTPVPNPGGNGFPVVADPGWGDGTSHNDGPITANPGWNGNQPTYWPNGNTGNNGGNTNNGNGPVE